MISITLLEENLFQKVRKHISKHEGKYLAGIGLATMGAGLLARSRGKNILKTSKPGSELNKAGNSVKNMGNVLALGGATTALRSGIYSLLKDPIKDLKKKNKTKPSQEIK